MSKYVINPLTKDELSVFLDDRGREIIKYFLIKSLFSQPEPIVGQKLLPIQVPKEHIEQWFTQALGVKSVGAGSYPIDIYNEREHWGADIKMLNIKLTPTGQVAGSDSGEASMGQNFKSAGDQLDTLFKSENFEEIKSLWITLLKSKYQALKKDYPKITKIYYFFILRPDKQKGKADFYFAGASVDMSKLKVAKVNLIRTTNQSVFISGLISEEFGNTRVYKAKKRMELRLKPKKWINSNYAIKITTSHSQVPVNLRDVVVDSSYLEKKLKILKKMEVKFID